VEKAKKEGIDLIIGFGGGSSLDIAKVTSIMITNTGKIDSFLESTSSPIQESP